MFTYLRHPQLAAWLALLGLLGGLLLFAQHKGEQPGARVGAQKALGAMPASSSAARANVTQLQGLGQSGIAAGTDPAAVSAWAAQVQSAASTGASTRAGEGATETDPLRATLSAIAAQAASLDAARAVPVTVGSLRTQILMRIDQASQIVSGIPTAPMPAAPASPLPSGKADTPIAPEPTVPTLPAPQGRKTITVPTHSTPADPAPPALPTQN